MSGSISPLARRRYGLARVCSAWKMPRSTFYAQSVPAADPLLPAAKNHAKRGPRPPSMTTPCSPSSAPTSPPRTSPVKATARFTRASILSPATRSVATASCASCARAGSSPRTAPPSPPPRPTTAASSPTPPTCAGPPTAPKSGPPTTAGSGSSTSSSLRMWFMRLRRNRDRRVRRHSGTVGALRKFGAAREGLDSCGGPHEPLAARKCGSCGPPQESRTNARGGILGRVARCESLARRARGWIHAEGRMSHLPLENVAPAALRRNRGPTRAAPFRDGWRAAKVWRGARGVGFMRGAA